METLSLTKLSRLTNSSSQHAALFRKPHAVRPEPPLFSGVYLSAYTTEGGAVHQQFGGLVCEVVQEDWL
jgi:hypothetical protein